jgi:DNA-binding PadR family transcriptional regulator
MYRSRDSETTRSSLEVFILTLIRQGFMTTYDLQSGAGLSLGATVPALNRLSDAKLVSRRIVGRRHEYALTRGGEQVLRDWEPPVRRAATDYEDLLRTAYLSAFLLRKPTLGAEILRKAARARSRAAEDRADDLHGTILTGRLPEPSAYRWMRLLSEQHRLVAESRALESIATHIEKSIRLPAKPPRKRK